jgi:hypothetical protein
MNSFQILHHSCQYNRKPASVSACGLKTQNRQPNLLTITVRGFLAALLLPAGTNATWDADQAGEQTALHLPSIPALSWPLHPLPPGALQPATSSEWHQSPASVAIPESAEYLRVADHPPP